MPLPYITPGTHYLNTTRVQLINQTIAEFNQLLEKTPSYHHKLIHEELNTPDFWTNLKAEHQFNPAAITDINTLESTWQAIYPLANVPTKDLTQLIDFYFPLLTEYIAYSKTNLEIELIKKNQFPYLQLNTIYKILKKPNSANLLFAQINELHTIEIELDSLKTQLLATLHHKLAVFSVNHDNLPNYDDCLDNLCEKLLIYCPEKKTAWGLKPTQTLHPDNVLLFTRYIKQENNNLAPLTLPILPNLFTDKKLAAISSAVSLKNLNNTNNIGKKLKARYLPIFDNDTPFLPNFSNFLFIKKIKLFFNFNFDFNAQALPAFIQWLILSVSYYPMLLRFLLFPTIAASWYIGLISFTTVLIASTLWAIKTFAPFDKLWGLARNFFGLKTQKHILLHTEILSILELSRLFIEQKCHKGAHHLASVDLDTLEKTALSYQTLLQKQAKLLKQNRPPIWKFWQRNTFYLICDLLKAINEHESALNDGLTRYADNISERCNQLFKMPKLVYNVNTIDLKPLLSQTQLHKITGFVEKYSTQESKTRFSHHTAVVDLFLACLFDTPDSLTQSFALPIVQLESKNHPFFAQHKINHTAIATLEKFINHYAQKPHSLELIHSIDPINSMITILQLLRNQKSLTLLELETHCYHLASTHYSVSDIKNRIQELLFMTYPENTLPPFHLYNTLQHKQYQNWLETQKNSYNEAKEVFAPLLNSPPGTDLSSIAYSEIFFNTSSENKRHWLHVAPTLREPLQQKLAELLPHYSGKPNPWIDLMPLLWPDKNPLHLLEQAFYAEVHYVFTKTIENTTHKIYDIRPLLKRWQLLYPDVDAALKITRLFYHTQTGIIPVTPHTKNLVESLAQEALFSPAGLRFYHKKILTESLYPNPQLRTPPRNQHARNGY